MPHLGPVECEGYTRAQEPALIPRLLLLTPALIPWGVLLPYLTGTAILLIGLYTVRKEFASRQGLDKIVALGPVFLAVPIAVFGTEHFTATKILAGMVPSWIPGHLFWALFVGACLISAALSIAVRKYSEIQCRTPWAHDPSIRASHSHPGSSQHSGLSITLVVSPESLAFSGGALSVAATQKKPWTPQVRQKLTLLARLFLGVPSRFTSSSFFIRNWRPEFLSQVDARLGSRARVGGTRFGVCCRRPMFDYQ